MSGFGNPRRLIAPPPISLSGARYNNGCVCNAEEHGEPPQQASDGVAPERVCHPFSSSTENTRIIFWILLESTNSTPLWTKDGLELVVATGHRSRGERKGMRKTRKQKKDQEKMFRVERSIHSGCSCSMFCWSRRNLPGEHSKAYPRPFSGRLRPNCHILFPARCACPLLWSSWNRSVTAADHGNADRQSELTKANYRQPEGF